MITPSGRELSLSSGENGSGPSVHQSFQASTESESAGESLSQPGESLSRSRPLPRIPQPPSSSSLPISLHISRHLLQPSPSSASIRSHISSSLAGASHPSAVESYQDHHPVPTPPQPSSLAKESRRRPHSSSFRSDCSSTRCPHYNLHRPSHLTHPPPSSSAGPSTVPSLSLLCLNT